MIKQLNLKKLNTIFGEVYHFGDKKKCAICGSNVYSKEFVLKRHKDKFNLKSFRICKPCKDEIKKTEVELIPATEFITSVRKRKKYKKIITLDIETTGMFPKGEIIEIGALAFKISVRKPKLTELFFQRIKPQTDYFDPYALKINRINPKDLNKSPTIDKVLPLLHEFIDSGLVVAHRANFDAGFLNYYFDKYYDKKRPKNDVLDTFKIGQFLYKKNLHLNELLIKNKINIPLSRHKSWVDCLTTGMLFFDMVKFFNIEELPCKTFDSYEYDIKDMKGDFKRNE